jgi:two-component system sensor histidine kinase AlgZ
VFDACHVGVILRAVLFVVAVVAVGAMFGTASPLDWLARTSIVTGGALPATLAWLIAGCSLKKPLARQRLAVQVAAGVGLGALAGLYGCGLLALAGFRRPRALAGQRQRGCAAGRHAGGRAGLAREGGAPRLPPRRA